MDDRRRHVPFDPRHFEAQARAGVRHSVADVFARIYHSNHWRGGASVSGEGSGRAQTWAVEEALPPLLRALGADVLLDLPCGDFGWMQHVDLPVTRYVGADIVPALIDRNTARYADARRAFALLDLTRDALPAADVLLCRDCLVHLSFADIARALANVRGSRIEYMLATTFPACPANEDAVTGDWRPLDLTRAPFSFPPPLGLIDERCTEGEGRFADKSLGLWRVADLPAPAAAVPRR